MKTRFRPEQLFCPFAVLVFALIFRVFLATELYADDIYYSTFFRDGLPAFFEKAQAHFETFNGRNFVHFVIWLVLAADKWLAALVMTAVLFASAALFAKAAGAKVLPTAVLFALLVLTLSPTILREGVFWTSAFFNYVFSFLCLTTVIALQKMILQKPSAVLAASLCPAFFLLCATTEQCGATAVFGASVFALAAMLHEKVFLPRLICAPVCGAFGTASIFLSPATLARMNAETGASLADIARSFAVLGGHVMHGGAVWLMLVFLALTFFFPHGRKRAVRAFALLCLAALCAVQIVPGKLCAFVAFALFCAYCIFCGALCLCSRTALFQGALLISGTFSCAVISLTASCEPRTTVPFALSLALFCAARLCAVSARGRAHNAANAILCLFCLCAFLPTFLGYMHNEKVRDSNAIAISSAKETGTLYYSTDYDETYAHTLMFGDGYFYNAFIELHGLESADIVLTSDVLPSVFCGKQKVPCPTVKKEGVLYFPLEPTIEKAGGSTAWSPHETEISIGNNKFTLRSSTVCCGEKVYDVSGMVRCDYYCMLVTEDFLRDMLGLSVTFDESKNAYTVCQKDRVSR